MVAVPGHGKGVQTRPKLLLQVLNITDGIFATWLVDRGLWETRSSQRGVAQHDRSPTCSQVAAKACFRLHYSSSVESDLWRVSGDVFWGTEANPQCRELRSWVCSTHQRAHKTFSPCWNPVSPRNLPEWVPEEQVFKRFEWIQQREPIPFHVLNSTSYMDGRFGARMTVHFCPKRSDSITVPKSINRSHWVHT
jgi:hypothetical protein